MTLDLLVPLLWLAATPMAPSFESENVGLGFGLVVTAGLCSSLGAALALVVRLESESSKRVLAVSMAVSAGVMLYVSMIEIFQESVDAFSQHYCPPPLRREEQEVCSPAFVAATGSFFLGTLLLVLIHALTSGKARQRLSHALRRAKRRISEIRRDKARGTSQDRRARQIRLCVTDSAASSSEHVSLVAGRPPTTEEGDRGKTETRCDTDCIELQEVSPSSEIAQRDEEKGVDSPDSRSPASQPDDLAELLVPVPQGWEARLMRGRPVLCRPGTSEWYDVLPALGEKSPRGRQGRDAAPACALADAAQDASRSRGLVGDVRGDGSGGPALAGAEAEEEQEQRKHLFMTGVVAGVAIALHNMPEGLATFIAAQADAKMGVGIAAAVALHNVPEGVCVAMPIAFATGDKCKAFGYASLSGLSEPLGALLGYAILGGEVSAATFGWMFGLVSGLMVAISLADLLPEALALEPNKALVSGAVLCGMFVMALSLVGFVV